jgi:CHAT domain-containing protein
MVSVSDSDSVLEHSKSQARYYISQIENGNNIEDNLWALTILGSENEEVRTFIEKINLNTKALSSFTDIEDDFQSQLKKVVFQTASPNLLIALLLETEDATNKRNIYKEFLSKFDLPDSRDISYTGLSETIINGEEISGKVLSDQKFLLPHFFLLWDSNYSTFFTDTYLSNLKTNWRSNYSSTSSLQNSLAEASYFRVLYSTSNYSETVSLYNSFINNKLLPNSSIKIKIYQFFDYTMYRLGLYNRSLNIVRNITLPLSQYLDQKDKELQFTQLQGVYLYSIGKIHQAQETYLKVLNLINKSDPAVELSSLYNNLALTHHQLGNYDKYLDLQLQALEIAKTNENYSHQLNVLNNLFIYHKQNNDPDNALLYLENAQSLAQQKEEIEELGNIYISLGAFYREFEKDFKKTHQYFNKAEEILDPNNNTKNYLDLLNEQAQTLEKEQKINLALEKYTEVINITNEKNPSHIDALINKAMINLKIDHIHLSKKWIDKYKSYPLTNLSFKRIIKAKTVEADYLQRTGEVKKAISILEPVLDQVVTRAKSSADLESGFWHVEDEYLDAFELAVSIYQKIGQPEKAVQKLDQLKTINDASLYQNPLVKSSLLNESELTQYKQLTEQLDATRKKLLTASEDQQFDIRQTISQLNLQKRKLDRKLTKQIDDEAMTVREVQNRLSARELVLHITELNEQFYIARISRSDISLNTIPLDSSLSSLLSNSVQRIATNETNLDSLYKISKILNLPEIPDRVEKIMLIPDSYFYQLPIDILPLEKSPNSYSYGETTYVIEKFRTQYLTSLEGFKSNSGQQSQLKNNLSYTGYGVSNFEGFSKKSLVSLPYARTEVTNIASKLTHLSNVQTFVNEQSTKLTFEKTAPESQIIHLATHSEVSERDPMFSTVYLSNTDHSPDSTFNNQIFAYELFELDLSNEMIMFNSCESGSGPYIQGTGVMGMSRALRYAGANSLVLNLWSVNDMLASDFAIHFYEELNKGKSKAEALQATKQYFLKNKNASPHFWGPYMLIGNSNPVVQPNQDKNIAMAGIFIFYFLLMVGLSYLTQQGFIFQNKQKKVA